MILAMSQHSQCITTCMLLILLLITSGIMCSSYNPLYSESSATRHWESASPLHNCVPFCTTTSCHITSSTTLSVARSCRATWLRNTTRLAMRTEAPSTLLVLTMVFPIRVGMFFSLHRYASCYVTDPFDLPYHV